MIKVDKKLKKMLSRSTIDAKVTLEGCKVIIIVNFQPYVVKFVTEFEIAIRTVVSEWIWVRTIAVKESFTTK